MMRESNATAVVGEEEGGVALRASRVGQTPPPADIVYDDGEIILELLQARAAEADRRRFVTALRRLSVVTED